MVPISDHRVVVLLGNDIVQVSLDHGVMVFPAQADSDRRIFVDYFKAPLDDAGIQEALGGGHTLDFEESLSLLHLYACAHILLQKVRLL